MEHPDQDMWEGFDPDGGVDAELEDVNAGPDIPEE